MTTMSIPVSVKLGNVECRIGTLTVELKTDDAGKPTVEIDHEKLRLAVEAFAAVLDE